jgi:hypothetical protein
MKLKKIILPVFFLLLFATNVSGVFATTTDITILPIATGESECSSGTGRTPTDCGDYAVSDFVSLAINVSKFILGLVGSLTLAMFVYGGFLFLISTGSSDKIGEAKKIITAALVGLIIVFASYVIISFVFKTMGLNWQGQVELPKKASIPLAMILEV